MLFSFLTSLMDQYSFLNVFKYLTFGTGLSVVSSLIVVFVIGGPLIKFFSEKMITGPIRQDGPIDHIIKKSGTPTMGGVIIIIGIIAYSILVFFLSEYFYLYFFGEFNTELLIFTFLHIGLAIFATLRSLIETIFQTKKYTHHLLKANLINLAIALIINFLLIYLAGINGAIISMIMMELILIIFLKVKYESIL